MLEVQRIFKTYEGKPLLNDISFTVAQEETVCLLGASGSGKAVVDAQVGTDEANLANILTLNASNISGVI